jgi:hypothetical protein
MVTRAGAVRYVVFDEDARVEGKLRNVESRERKRKRKRGCMVEVRSSSQDFRNRGMEKSTYGLLYIHML